MPLIDLATDDSGPSENAVRDMLKGAVAAVRTPYSQCEVAHGIDMLAGYETSEDGSTPGQTPRTDVSSGVSPPEISASVDALFESIINPTEDPTEDPPEGTLEAQFEEEVNTWIAQQAAPTAILDAAGPRPETDADPSPSMQEFLSMGFYEVLEVEPGASPVEISKAFKRLALIHHPDKGGHPLRMAYIRKVYEILSNKKTRFIYDEQGRAPFEQDLPKETPPPATPQPQEGYTVHTEVISVDFTRKMQEIIAIRQMDNCGLSYAMILEAFLKRVRNVKGGVGEITTIWRENPRSVALNWGGRQRSGVHGMAILPEEVQDEGGDERWRGLSAFGLPSILRNGMRSGFGKGMLDYDQQNAHFEAAWALVQLYELPESEFEALKTCVKTREMWLENLGKELHCSRRDAKTQTLATGYLQALTHDAPMALRKLRGEMEALMDEIAAREPERIEVVRTWGSKRPKVTMASYAFMNLERQELDRMANAAAGHVMCPEGDGIVVLEPTTAMDSAIKASTSRVVVVKPYPQCKEEWVTMSNERYPHSNFEIESRYRWGKVSKALALTTNAVRSPKADTMAIHTDFALVLAACLEQRIIINKEVHVFDKHKRLWSVISDKGLPGFISEAVQDIWGERSVRFRRGVEMPLEHANAKLKDHGWLAKVRMETQALLCGSPAEYNLKRNLMAFADGRVYNWDTNRVQPGEPWMNIRFALPYKLKDLTNLTNLTKYEGHGKIQT